MPPNGYKMRMFRILAFKHHSVLPMLEALWHCACTCAKLLQFFFCIQKLKIINTERRHSQTTRIEWEMRKEPLRKWNKKGSNNNSKKKTETELQKINKYANTFKLTLTLKIILLHTPANTNHQNYHHHHRYPQRLCHYCYYYHGERHHHLHGINGSHSLKEPLHVWWKQTVLLRDIVL